MPKNRFIHTSQAPGKADEHDDAAECHKNHAPEVKLDAFGARNDVLVVIAGIKDYRGEAICLDRIHDLLMVGAVAVAESMYSDAGFKRQHLLKSASETVMNLFLYYSIFIHKVNR